MTVGTKSLLFGAHALWLHPFLVALAWHRLYSTPRDPRLWCAFLLHDIGYWGKRDMNGPDGERHVLPGAAVLAWLFGPEWGDLCHRHSRAWAAREGCAVSPLGVADKLAFALTPAWLYVPLARWSGELDEYRGSVQGDGFTAEEQRLLATGDDHAWVRALQAHTLRWVAAHTTSGATEFADPVAQ